MPAMRPILATLAIALAAPTMGADVPALLLPPSLGRPDRVWIAGRVLEEEHRTSGPAALRNARQLGSSNLPRAPVHASLLGRAGHGVSGHDGAFEIEIPAAPGEPFPAGELRVTVVVPGASAEAAVHVVPAEAPFLVVSDFDDTVAVTGVTRPRTLLASTFLEDADTQPAVPGMADLYRCLLAPRPQGTAPVLAIVSGSPIQLAPRMVRFLARNGFPPAALYLRDLGPKTLSGYKPPVLERLAARFPQPFVLVGDSGEKDPEIYAAFAAAHPGRVLATFIRRATPHPGPPARFAGARLFGDPAQAGREAAARGLADAACVEVAFDAGAGSGAASPPRP